MDPPVKISREAGDHMKWCREPWCSSRGRQVCQGTFWVASRVPGTVRPSRRNVGLLLRWCRGKGLHLSMTWEQRGFSRDAAGFSSYDGDFRMPLVLAQGSPIFHSSCEGELGLLLSHSRVNSPPLGLCPETNIPLQGRQGSRGCISDSPGESGLVSSGSKELQSPLELRGVSLEPTEWPKGSQASCGVLREDM